MHMADLGDIRLHYRLDGPEDGAPLVLIHALGTDLRLWDALMTLAEIGATPAGGRPSTAPRRSGSDARPNSTHGRSPRRRRPTTARSPRA